ncbi:unnamed protein product [Nippostrongylus brasiliensis]|uniref:ADAM family mig-17 (inferred by orthology to a C. elegans protein) n=1 Tax=Nippostrongylus brasiliensis TaxID=27835 RepID=A0A0N4XT32_NIPBR|nr:unnamed protein product [Nippostrongylus brasiliensis]
MPFMVPEIVADTIEVQLRRKITQGGVSLTRIQKYTSETLPSLRNETDFSLGLDILMMADYSTLQGFIEISGNNAAAGELYTQEYLRAIFEQVKTIYDGIEIMKQTIQLSLVGTFVAIREDDCPMLNSIENIEDEVLSSNSTFDNSTIGVGYEEANNSTEFDLLSPRGDSATQGMSYVGNICKVGDSASIVEDIGAAATAIIAAHELGHSLGAFHDGNPEAQDCPSSENFLMASTVSGSENFELFAHSRTMSPCSIKSIEKNLRTKSAQCVKKAASGDRKLKKKSSTLDQMSRTSGEMIGLRQQCQIAFGPHYGVCPNKEYFRGSDLCRRVWCKDREQRRSEPCETKTYLPSLDGTECGRTKVCDFFWSLQLLKLIQKKTIKKYSKVKLRHYCKAKDFKEICCRSCAQLKDLH